MHLLVEDMLEFRFAIASRFGRGSIPSFHAGDPRAAAIRGGGANSRFVVTSLPAERADARILYEEFYCARDDLEYRIKEQQPGLIADRTSAQSYAPTRSACTSPPSPTSCYAHCGTWGCRGPRRHVLSAAEFA